MVMPILPWTIIARPPPGSSRAVIYKYTNDLKVAMAKNEIHKRTLNILSNLWWKYMPGTVIEVKWPTGWFLIHEMMDGTRTSGESADPNDHYRPALEKNVGKQGWDWDWRIGCVWNADDGVGTTGYATLLIKFRKSKEEYATVAKLKWG